MSSASDLISSSPAVADHSHFYEMAGFTVLFSLGLVRVLAIASALRGLPTR